MKMRQRVLLVYARNSGELLNRQAALGSYIFCLCELLEKQGREVLVNGVPFKNFGKGTTEKRQHETSRRRSVISRVPGFIKKPLRSFVDLKQIQALEHELMKGKDYDVILEFYSCASGIGAALSRKYSVPLMLVYDNPVEEEYRIFHGRSLFFNGVMRKREKQSLEAAQGIVVYSKSVANYLEKKYARKFPFHIHQNVDYSRFDFIPVKAAVEPVNIGFIGSFLKWHRVELLVNVFNRLRSEGKNVKLYLLGRGIEYDAIKKQVEKSVYSSDIVMPGFVDGQELKAYKEKIHIGIMPGSNWYGAPNKIFEYGAAGMAVVAPETPTISDLFANNRDLLLFRQDNEDDLYGKLMAYLDNEGGRVRLAQNLQRRIMENYSEKITIDFYSKLLDQAANEQLS